MLKRSANWLPSRRRIRQATSRSHADVPASDFAMRVSQAAVSRRGEEMSEALLNATGREYIDSDESSRIEQQLLERLMPYMAIMPLFSYTMSNRCQEKGLLPGHLLAALEVLQFLSCTVLSAQKAQRVYGVRASVLLAMALDEASFDANDLLKNGKLLNDYSGEPSISPQIDEWFLARAKMLATSKRFKMAMNLNSDVKAYIRRICDLGFCDHLKAEDLCQNVETYELQECDLAGMLPVGVYETYLFEKVRDDLGSIVELKLSKVGRLKRFDEFHAGNL